MPKVSTKRQITIPIDLCQQAHIEPGDDIETFIHEGQITIVKKQKNAARGILGHIKSRKKVTDEQSLNDSLASRRQAYLVISVDTNVLLRYLLQDDKDQSPKANKLFSSTKKVLITDMVLVEALWTLKGKRYNLGKQDQLMVLSQLFKEPNVIFENRQTMWSAMNSFRLSEKIKIGNKKKEADFADAFILEKSKSICIEKRESFDGLFTFDVDSQQFDGSKESKQQGGYSLSSDLLDQQKHRFTASAPVLSA